MVGGQRDVAYTDIDTGVRRATEDGEQIVEEFPEEEPARPVTVIVDEPESAGRPPGKLYGRSLVDELEHRKAVMRSKQRVFTGDDRPSMMARGPMRRSTTLIDPTSLKQRPISQNVLAKSQTRPDLARRGSFGGKPLLNFDEDQPSGLAPSPGGRAARKSRRERRRHRDCRMLPTQSGCTRNLRRKEKRKQFPRMSLSKNP